MDQQKSMKVVLKYDRRRGRYFLLDPETKIDVCICNYVLNKCKLPKLLARVFNGAALELTSKVCGLSDEGFVILKTPVNDGDDEYTAYLYEVWHKQEPITRLLGTHVNFLSPILKNILIGQPMSITYKFVGK